MLYLIYFHFTTFLIWFYFDGYVNSRSLNIPILYKCSNACFDVLFNLQIFIQLYRFINNAIGTSGETDISYYFE